MAKMGKVKKEAIEKDKEERARQFQGFQKWMKFKPGTNFFRMLPPQEGQDLPWIKVRKHFNLGSDGNGICNCTETGKDCFICKKVRIAENSSNKKEREKAAEQRVSTSYVSQGIDMKPLYSKQGKNKWVPDNPPPKCWGNPKKDEDDEFVGKCQRCSWNESCDRGIQLCALSGQRIDDIADHFDECDITDLKNGRNILIKRKGQGRYNTSYKIKIKKSFEYKLPKHMIAFIEENFIDLVEELAPASPEETEEAYYGSSAEDDLPDCFSKFQSSKKKCKKCEYSDLCKEENEEDDDNDNDNDDNDNNDNDNNDNDNNDNNDDDNNDNDDDDDNDNDNDDDDNDNDDDEDEDDNDNNDNDDDEEEKSKKKSKKSKDIKKELKKKAAKKRK